MVNGGIVLGVFVILLLNNKGVRKTRANTFLSILLAALTFSIFHVRYAGDVISHFSMSVFSVGDPMRSASGRIMGRMPFLKQLL